MTNITRVVSFGSSTTGGADEFKRHEAWAAVLARRLNLPYVCQAKPSCSNSKIARKILSYSKYSNDLVVAMWTAINRYEFKTENGWNGFTTNSKSEGFVKAWYEGPGNLEYTEVSIAIKEILLAQQFLKAKNLPYIFAIDNNGITGSYFFKNPDEYMKSLIDLIDWDNFLLFDGQGFIPWAQSNNFEVVVTHPLPPAHIAAADYLLSHSKINLVNPTQSIHSSNP